MLESKEQFQSMFIETKSEKNNSSLLQLQPTNQKSEKSA